MADLNPITQTTLSVALGGPTLGRLNTQGSPVTPASMTNVLAPGPNKSNRTILWIDREALEVISITTTLAICHRGVFGTLAVPHVAGTPIWVGTEQDFSAFNENENRGGLGLYGPLSVSFETINPTTAADTATLTVAQLLGGLITGTPTAAANYTLPTATLIVAALGSWSNPYIGQSFEFTIKNTSAGANTITAVAGTGVTLTGTATVAQNAIKRFRLVVTNVITPTVTVYSLGSSTF